MATADEFTDSGRSRHIRRLDPTITNRLPRGSEWRTFSLIGSPRVKFGDPAGGVLRPPIQRRWIQINQDVAAGWSLELCDRILPREPRDVNVVRRNLVDQPLINAWTAFSTWVSHGLECRQIGRLWQYPSRKKVCLTNRLFPQGSIVEISRRDPCKVFGRRSWLDDRYTA